MRSKSNDGWRRRLAVLVVSMMLAFSASAALGQEEAPVPASPAAAPASTPAAPVVIYTKDNAPKTPTLEELPLKDSVSNHEVTWTFERPARAGQFVNGEWYVVGPVTVVKIDPAPLWGEEVKDVTEAEKKKPVADLIRNGSLLNISLENTLTGFDSRSGNFTNKLRHRPPIAMTPGDALISTVSDAKPHSISGGTSPVGSAAVLACLKGPVPADAWRPSYGDRSQTVYLARNLHRDRLLNLPRPAAKVPELGPMADRYAAPWLEVTFFGRGAPRYQKEYGRAACQLGAETTLSLLMDYKPQEKERLLVNYVQYAVDIYGLVKNGFHGWVAWGGWGSGRKWPIVFAGILLDDKDMANVNKTLPKALFGEDMHTMYDRSWTGAGVVYAGHTGKEGGKNDFSYGPYEHLHPSRWMIGMIGQAYRCDMTSSTWIGQALAIRLMNAEENWGYDAFMDYCDRWMYEPDPGFGTWGKQGEVYKAWPWVKEMWDKYRLNLPALAGKESKPRPPTGWKREPAKDSASVAVEIGQNREFRVQGKPFFPLMMFAESPARIEQAKALGMNTVAEGCFLSGGMDKFVSNADFLDALAKSGLYGVFGADMRVAGHPNLLGWIQIDEPDKVLSRPRAEWKKILPCSELILKEKTKDPNFPAPPQVIVSTAYEWMKKVGKSRPVFLTLGASILKDEGPLEPAVKQKEYPEYLKACDVAGCAVYPITAGHGAGRLDAVAKGVATLREMAGPGKPVFAWIETGAAAPPPATRRARSASASAPASATAPAHLSPAQMRAEAWMAIIGGATALGFRGFEGYADVKVDGETAAELKRLNEQIARLAPALLAGAAKARVEIEMEGRLPCHVKATENEGAVYVFVQNLDLGAGKAPDAKPRGGKATIKVAGLKAGTKIEVVDENRSITAGEAQFTDEFAPLAEHVYKLAAP